MTQRRSDVAGGFTAWLFRQRHRDDPIGDLARDAFHDSDWPRRATRFDEFERCLDKADACQEAQRALLRAWGEWDGAQTGDGS
jgi:uncharacterized protein YozE (UPF0346 family)